MPTTCTSATDITSNSFVANWDAANNATSYFLDLSTDNDFTDYVPGYENLQIGTSLNAEFTGLNENTEYFYRIRVEYGTYLSQNSNIISVSTTESGINNIYEDKIKIYAGNGNIIIYSNLINQPKLIQIFDIRGKLINEISEPDKTEIITINNKGIYLIKLVFDDFVLTKKIILH